ncbi:MAG: hypothetical protein NTZ74_09775 [Chloroflexi bacterium]|nr:hypothetical protein [Chloroflexota bacterium]
MNFVDDLDFLRILLETVENWARENQLITVHGPPGFTDLDREAKMGEGFNELSNMATFNNYTYCSDHIEKHGYAKDVDWVE